MNFILGRRIYEIDNILLKIRLPIESSHALRSLNDRCHFKANEWRTLAFYIIAPVLNEFKSKYVNNLIKYVLFLRILCDNIITVESLDIAMQLIEELIVDFQKLYGSDSMKFNIHSHLHLVSQVKRFGPLNICSCFPFENMFKVTRNMFHGTRNHESQIARNLVLSKHVKSEINKLNEQTDNTILRNYLSANISNDKPIINSLINSRKITYNYSISCNYYNCYTVEINNVSSLEYGIIMNFYSIGDAIYFLFKK